jgi:hypothetical protein
MPMKKKVLWLAFVLPLALANLATGQEKVEPEKTPAKAITPLSVQVVFVRYQGEKKTTSLPYVLSVNANEPQGTRLRIGLRVPLMTRMNDAAQVVLKNVGTSIDCSAESLEGGLFRLSLALDQSSVNTLDGNVRWSETDLSKLPLMPFLELSTTAYLRPGQTAQYTVAADPFTGETAKVEVTLNLVK